MNLYRIASILRNSRDNGTSSVDLDYNTNIDVDVEDATYDGRHTDDDSIVLHMENGDKWCIQMEKIN